MKNYSILNRPFTFSGNPDTQYFCVDTLCDAQLNVREVSYVRLDGDGHLPEGWRHHVMTTRDTDSIVTPDLSGCCLNGVYEPAADMASLNTVIPDDFDEPWRQARAAFTKAVGGDVREFACAKLHMSPDELSRALMAEQVDGAALAIYNIEARHQSLVIGDQTGIGKGRQAAAVIRYALAEGYTPVFITANGFLFSDMYRDCKALGLTEEDGELRISPMIFNADSPVVDYTGDNALAVDYSQHEDETEAEREKRINKALKELYPTVFEPATAEDYARRGKLPKGRNCVFATYSQFSSSKPGKIDKKAWLEALVAKGGCIFILDEAHKAAGEKSNTGRFLSSLIPHAVGCLFLSATYAKNGENLGFFAQRTLIGEAGVARADLAETIEKGGNSLQEVVSQQLVACGQMLRRERKTKGVEVKYITPENCKDYEIDIDQELNRAAVDKVTGVLRELMTWYQEHVETKDWQEKNLDEERKRVGLECDNDIYIALDQVGSPDAKFVAKVPKSPVDYLFIFTEALILSAKAQAVAERTVWHVEHGHKAIVALSKTAESTLCHRDGTPFSAGEEVKGDFGLYIDKVIHGMEAYEVSWTNVSDEFGKLLKKQGYKPVEVGRSKQVVWSATRPSTTDEGLRKLKDIAAAVRKTNYRIPCSPIDAIESYLREKGVDYRELTGRKMRIDYPGTFDYSRATVDNVRKVGKAEAVNDFQNNVVDVLIINQSAATGVSCHAIPTAQVPVEQVKQRYMIMAQPELEVNTEVQKMGRIDRTGQLVNIPPQYEYILPGIPVEDRMTMMLKTKMQGLFANTSSDRHAKDDHTKNIPDFNNKYGDAIVKDWLETHSEACKHMGIKGKITEKGCASLMTTRIALLECDEQEAFYTYVISNYEERKKSLTDAGEWDIDLVKNDYKAELVTSREPALVSLGASPFFGGNVYAATLKWQLRINTSFERLRSYADELKKNNITAHEELLENADVKRYFDYAIPVIKAIQSHGFVVFDGADPNHKDEPKPMAILGVRAKLNVWGEVEGIRYLSYRPSRISTKPDSRPLPSIARGERELINGDTPEAKTLWETPIYKKIGVYTGNVLAACAKIKDYKENINISSCTLRDGGTLLYVKDKDDGLMPSSLLHYAFPLCSDIFCFIKRTDSFNVYYEGERWQATAHPDERKVVMAAPEAIANSIIDLTGAEHAPKPDIMGRIKIALCERDLDRLGEAGYTISHRGHNFDYTASSPCINMADYLEAVRSLPPKELWPRLDFDKAAIKPNEAARWSNAADGITELTKAIEHIYPNIMIDEKDVRLERGKVPDESLLPVTKDNIIFTEWYWADNFRDTYHINEDKLRFFITNIPVNYDSLPLQLQGKADGIIARINAHVNKMMGRTSGRKKTNDDDLDAAFSRIDAALNKAFDDIFSTLNF